MIYLFLCILCSSIILLLFKYLDNKGIDSFQTIVVNYFVAVVFGLILYGDTIQEVSQIQTTGFQSALIVGVLFIVVFFLIAKSTKHAGVATTSVATKMSVVIPVIFSLWRYNELLDWRKILGISIALIALYLTVYKKEERKGKTLSWLLPLLIFFGTGIVDTIIKYSQAEHITSGGIGFFNIVVFSVALLIGLIVALATFMRQVRRFSLGVLWGGTILGIANFGSLYFLISALNSSGLDSSVLFPLNNIGVVVISVASAIIIFKEKVTRINLIGVVIAIFAVLLLVGN